MISAAVGRGGETMISAQTVEAFWNAVQHVKPLSVGLNCSLGPDLMRPFLEELADKVRRRSSPAIRTPALPNPLSPTGFDLEPRTWAATSANSRTSGLMNIAGGCCGNTPEHIAAIAKALRRTAPPRESVASEPKSSTGAALPLRLSGSQPFTQQIGSLPHDRRAHERHRLAEVREAHQGRQTTRKPSPSPGSRSRTAPTSSTSTWTKG